MIKQPQRHGEPWQGWELVKIHDARTKKNPQPYWEIAESLQRTPQAVRSTYNKHKDQIR